MPGSYGRIHFGSDFTGTYADVVWGTGSLVSGDTWGGGLGFVSVNEGSFASTVDESGGILAITSDTGDNDNAFLRAGPFAPRDGVIEVEARFKYSNVDVAVWVGMTETLDGTTPVMPGEFATATMTYNGTGGMVGFNYDADGTTDDFRAHMGDGGAAISDSSNGTRANATLTADRWFEAKVVLNPDGTAECWLGDSGHANSNSMNNLRMIKRYSTGTLLTTTDLFFVALGLENRSANARILEVDYVFGSAGRDWRFN